MWSSQAIKLRQENVQLTSIMKKFTWGLFLLFVLCSVVLYLHSINFVKASGTIYIRPNGSVEGTDKIQRDGNVYTFTAVINDEIVVERDNIVVDGASFTLQGTGSGTGIYLNGRFNVTIRNMEITDYPTGIYVFSSSNCTISESSLTAIQENGIYISGSLFTLISENNIMDRSSSSYGIGIGIYVVDSNHTTIIANSISRVNYSVRVRNVSNSILMENNLVNNNIGIKTGYAFSNTISKNNCTSNLSFQGETVLDNITRQGIGISLGSSSSSNYVYQNNIEGNMWGMELESSWGSPQISSDNRIFENLVANNDYGVVLRRFFNNEFYHNIFLNNTLQVYDWAKYDPTWGFSENTWDKGYLVGGNFWSNYGGDDIYSGPYQNETSSDGIIDTAYVIDSRNQDHYPFANPWHEHLNPPVARFNYYPTVSSVGEETVFNASSSFDLDEGIESYYWNFDDDNISLTTDSVIGHTYEFPGIFNVTVTVIDSKSFNSSYYQIVTVKMPTFVSISTSFLSGSLGFTVNINGTLSDTYGNGLENEEVLLYYALGVPGGWNPIASDTTDIRGSYSAMWIPPTIDYYTIKVQWIGNSTHFGTYNETNLNMQADTSISLSSSTSYVGFKVEINGSLTCNEIGFLGAPILLSYSVTGGESWNDITLVNTTLDGSYFVVWMPAATGDYIVKADVTDSDYPGTIITVNLAVIPFGEQNVFSVTSNSTVSALAFNSTSRELSFTVTGPSGTSGYVSVYIAKTLVENIADVKIYLNDEPINYTATSLDDSWLIQLTYLHSTNKIAIALGNVSAPFVETLLVNAVIYVVVSIAAIVIIVLFILKRKLGANEKKPNTREKE